MATKVLRPHDCLAPAFLPGHHKSPRRPSQQPATSSGRRHVELKRPEEDKAVYAGAGFAASPSPSSLPLPGFLISNRGDELATRDLKRLLRLD